VSVKCNYYISIVLIETKQRNTNKSASVIYVNMHLTMFITLVGVSVLIKLLIL